MNREKEIIKTSIIGIAGNILLVAFKAFVGMLAGSVAIMMDALNNLTDALSSIITIIGTKLSGKRPDKKHPFGHGRIEYITSTVIAILILFAGGMAIYESVESIIDYFKNGTMPKYEVLSLVIISVAIIIKIGIGLYFKKRGKNFQSDALQASGTDAMFDSVLSIATLLGAVVALFAGVYVEGYLGIIIGVFILRSGFEVLSESLSSIIGSRFDKDYTMKIKHEICSVEGVNGCYDLILNSYGYSKNIGSVHIGVDCNLTAIEIQHIERNIATLMYNKYNTIMTVGIYAEDFSDIQTKKLHEETLEILKKYPNALQIHGFYLDKERNTLNFDLVISFDDDTPMQTISKIKDELRQNHSDLTILINYDQDFSLS